MPILVTPFDVDGNIDQPSLKSLIEFNIASGVHGLGVALGSEVFKFNEAERDTVIRCVVGTVAGRVPVVINTGANGTDLAVYYSRRAEELGADALMVIPPNFAPVGPDEVVDYYRRISAAVSIPIFLQDVPPAPISPGMALRIARETENVRYIKVETLPVTSKGRRHGQGRRRGADHFRGRRGQLFHRGDAARLGGTMPFCSQPADFVRVWDLFQQGDEAGRARPSIPPSWRSTGSGSRASTSITTCTSRSWCGAG